MYALVWKKQAQKDLEYFSKSEPQVLKKIMRLAEALETSPKTGVGMPEMLKNELSGYWSRRITHEHRLIYRIDESVQSVSIVQCRFHYKK